MSENMNFLFIITDQQRADSLSCMGDEEIAKDKIMRLRTLVTENHRITIYDGYNKFGDIFDLLNDPDEINNLWNINKELRNSLIERLMREIISLQPRVPKRDAYN